MIKHLLIALAIVFIFIAGAGYYAYSHRQELAQKAVEYTMKSIKGTLSGQQDEDQTWLGSLMSSNSANIKKSLIKMVAQQGLGLGEAPKTSEGSSERKSKNLKPGLATIADMLANGAGGEGNADMGQMAQVLINTFNAGLSEQTAPYAEQCSDVNARDAKGRTLLMNICRFDVTTKVLKWVIKYGADINATDNEGHTALMFASALNQDPEIVEMLLSGGADASLEDSHGKTALDYAKTTEVKKLLQAAMSY